MVPILNALYKDKQKRALIITPTRELAQQIQKQGNTIARGSGVFTTLCIGGTSISQQVYALGKNPHIVIGTPGRLKDLEERRAINFSKYNIIVLDEVDRMLDMGFIHDMRFIVSKLPLQRQSLFFSATASPAVEQIMKTFLKNPVIVSVKTGATADNVEQDIVKLHGRHKLDVLHDILSKDEVKKAIVFGRTKHGVERLSRELYTRQIKAVAIHGNKTQSQRRHALEKFIRNEADVLVATDVASRGLDIKGVTHVINFELPDTYEDYVHRIGRTGRAGQKGIALSFID